MWSRPIPYPAAPILLVLLAGVALPRMVCGQAVSRGGGGEMNTAGSRPVTQQDPEPVARDAPRSWWSLWSTSSRHDRVFLGMWTFHPFEPDPFDLQRNGGLGVQFRSFFGFTCVNSFERRTWVVGVERSWIEAERGPFGVLLGFRAGLIRGYDTDLFQVAGQTPVLPFAGVLALLHLGPVGGEVSWVYKAVSLVGAILF